ncbi:mitotic checkpoint serine/threonine-protein kinase BUB1 beta [Callorhinchus milii]|uniref:mitotic checkpoint serine/threonine-protein kinase BUB1 beta n=1 Tax=Callorhinchus milii TaxID=7868 RepID=UPI001C3FE1AA|nr:mitotic checkpoint serine/threonine-protein kinase BUB1 beta [Callorhinchus milii]XP_007891383.2 mitotic checkpoint serine/threonine-protein kinase BUB1 beta [Callorhinchus milii]
MMAEAEWELSKENVQPLKQGRVVSTLQGLLTHDGPSHMSIQEQKQAFEAEIRFYSGDDPLDVWDRYIKWKEQMFPNGGSDSNLTALLKRALEVFIKDQRYYNDFRYVSHWLKFVDCCVEPLEIFNFLKSTGIGVSYAAVYIAWAERYELLGNNKKADAVLQEGIQLKAEPLEKLLHHHRHFQARVAKQVMLDINEGVDKDSFPDTELQRTTLGELKGHGRKKIITPVSRVGSSMSSQKQGLQLHVPPPQQQGCSFKVFSEDGLSNPSRDQRMPAPQPQAALPSSTAKENELEPGPWNTARVHQHPSVPSVPYSQLLSASKPNFQLFVDESAQPATVTTRTIEPWFTPVLSSRKPSEAVNPFIRLQAQDCEEEQKQKSMYLKEKVNAGLCEFSFEELRAEEFKKKYKRSTQEQEQKLCELKQQSEEMERLIQMAQRRLENQQASLNPQSQPAEREITNPTSMLGACNQSIHTDQNVSSHVAFPERCQSHIQNITSHQPSYSGFTSNPLVPESELSQVKVEEMQRNEGFNDQALKVKSSHPSNFTPNCRTSTIMGANCIKNYQPTTSGDQHTLSGNPSLQLVQPSPTLYTKEAMDAINDMFQVSVTSSRAENESQLQSLFTIPCAHNDKDLEFEARFMNSGKGEDQCKSTSVLLPSSFGLGSVPFTIFDESEESENKSSTKQLQTGVRRPLSGVLSSHRIIPVETSVAQCVDLDGIEPLNEDLIVSSDLPNKTLGPYPENTCDFARAAHLASTPFHCNRLNEDQESAVKWDSINASKSAFSSLSPLKESLFDQPLHLKKLSPIQEASDEDGQSSAATTSSAVSSSSSMGGLSTMRDLNLCEKLDLGQSTSCENFHVNVTSDDPWSKEVQKQLLGSLHKTLNSFPEFHVQSSPLPHPKDGSVLNLGSETFKIKQAVGREQCRRFYGSSTSSLVCNAIIKVDSHTVPWDFYINQQLKERLGSQFSNYFSSKCSCYLFEDGCVTVDWNMNCKTIQDLLQGLSTLQVELTLFLTLDLLALVEQLHQAEIVHGDVQPETLFLGDWFCKPSTSCVNIAGMVKLVDFTHSLDLRQLSDVASFAGFPMVQSLHTKEVLSECSSVYQIDLLGVANTVHLLLFGEQLNICKKNTQWVLTSFRENLPYSKLWATFFEKILNPGEMSSVHILKELRQAMKDAIEPEYTALYNAAIVQSLEL